MTLHDSTTLAKIPADRLTARLYELRDEERRRLVEFLAYLGELDRRKLYLDLGFGSVFAFCLEHLGLSKGAAYRRMTAARLTRQFPVVAEYLADGRLTLTTLVELRDVLCEHRLDEILARAAGRTEEEVKVLVASLQPRPEPGDLLRRFPTPSLCPAPSLSSGSSAPATAMPSAPVSSGPGQAEAEVRQPTLPLTTEEGPAVASESTLEHVPKLEATQRRPLQLEPLGPARYLLRAAVSQTVIDDLRAAQSLLSHQMPDGNLEDVLAECLRIAVGVLSKKRRGAGKPPRSSPPAGDRTSPKKRTRYIAAAVRDQVWRRDDGRCAFTAKSGRRCGSTWQLEIHHRIPFARGGPSTVDQLELRCRAHNAHAAEKDFGAEHMANARRRAGPAPAG